MSFFDRIKEFFRGKRFLCDDCLYDYHGACKSDARPNATRCPEYKRRY
jgi:hypothetical protein